MIEKVNITETKNLKGLQDSDEIFMSILYHQDNIKKVMRMISEHILDVGDVHDWTKLDYFDEFYNDCFERRYNPVFSNREWYNIHCKFERHHLNSKIPDDVDLFDVLESIVDCIVTAKSQNIKVNPFFLLLRDDVLQEAYWNTIKKLEDNIILSE